MKGLGASHKGSHLHAGFMKRERKRRRRARMEQANLKESWVRVGRKATRFRNIKGCLVLELDTPGGEWEEEAAYKMGGGKLQNFDLDVRPKPLIKIGDLDWSK